MVSWWRCVLAAVLLFVGPLPASCVEQSTSNLSQSQQCQAVEAINQVAILEILSMIRKEGVPAQCTCCADISQDLQTLRAELEALKSEINTARRIIVAEKVCPEPFFKVGTECFFINDQATKTWHEARESCKTMDADLAEPEDFNAFIEVKKQRVGHTNMWLGLSDLAYEGLWVGVSGKVVNMKRAPWSPGDPNNHGYNEHCLLTWVNSLLADAPCDWKKIFACEYQLL